MNELFDWLNNIIALRIKMHNQIVQSFLDRKIVNVEEKENFKSSISSIVKGKKIS